MIEHKMEQGSDEWFAARCGIPTGSEFKSLIDSKGNVSKSLTKYAYSKACEKFAGERVDPFAGNKWTDAGTEDEDGARDEYAFKTGSVVTQIGFVTMDDGSCGCSPDSLVDDYGLLELKRLKGDLLVEAHLYYKKHGTIKPAYVQQVQGQMMICERDWCDVVFYNPMLPSLTIRVYPDSDVVFGLVQQIAACNKLRDETLKSLEWE